MIFYPTEILAKPLIYELDSYDEVDGNFILLFIICRAPAKANQGSAHGQQWQPTAAHGTHHFPGQIAGQGTSIGATANPLGATAGPPVTKAEKRNLLSERQAAKFRNLEVSHDLQDMFWM